MTERIRVLLVDDQELFRRGLSMVLAADEDIEIFEASDGGEALNRIGALVPDVVLLDVRMPGESGVDVCRALKSASPSSGIIMLTSSDEETDLYASIKNGASGYLLKDASIDEVADAVRLVASGQSLLSPAMATKLLEEFVQVSTVEAEPEPDAFSSLTKRERAVLRHLARGLSNRQIGEEMQIKENTVKNHIANILDKLQMKSRVEAALYGQRTELADSN